MDEDEVATLRDHLAQLSFGYQRAKVLRDAGYNDGEIQHVLSTMPETGHAPDMTAPAESTNQSVSQRALEATLLPTGNQARATRQAQRAAGIPYSQRPALPTNEAGDTIRRTPTMAEQPGGAYALRGARDVAEIASATGVQNPMTSMPLATPSPEDRAARDDAEAQADDERKQDHPVAARVGEFVRRSVPFLATMEAGGAVLPEALEGGSLLARASRIGRSATQMGAAEGMQGAGRGESPEEIAADAARGAQTGAVFAAPFELLPTPKVAGGPARSVAPRESAVAERDPNANPHRPDSSIPAEREMAYILGDTPKLVYTGTLVGDVNPYHPGAPEYRWWADQKKRADPIYHGDMDERLAQAGAERTPDGDILVRGERAQEANDYRDFGQRADERGATLSPVVRALGGATAGAVGGAAAGALAGGSSDEKRADAIGGGALGGALGLAAGLAPEALRSAREPRDVPAQLPQTPLTERPAPVPPAPGEAVRVNEVTPPLEPDYAVNFGRLAQDPTGRADVAARVSVLKAQGGIPPNLRVSFNDVRAEAAHVDVDAALRQGGGVPMRGAEGVAIKEAYDTAARQLGAIYKRLGNTGDTITDAERENLWQSSQILENRSDALLKRYVRGASENGRQLGALRMLAAQTTDPFTWMAKAQRILGDRPLTDEIRTKITRLTNEGAPQALADYVATLRRGTGTQLLTHTYVASLISSFSVYGKALTGSLTFAALEHAAQPVAATFDALATGVASLAGATARRTTTYSLAMERAAASGFRKGVQNAAQMLRGGTITDPLAGRAAKYLESGVTYDNPLARALSRVNDFIGRTHGTYSAISSRMGTEFSLEEQARVMALNEGLKGPAFDARVAALRKAPTNEMVLRAVENGARMSLTNRGLMARMASALRREATKDGPIASAAVVAAAPITQVPANAAARLAEYSPLGLAKGVVMDVPRFLRAVVQNSPELPAAQRRMVLQLAHGAVGTTPILAGFVLAQRGLMTGAMPRDPATAAVWKQSGKKPFALLYHGQWVQVGAIAPLGMLLGYGATLNQLAHGPEKPGPQPEELTLKGTLQSQPLQSAAALGQVVTDQPFLQSPANITDAARDPNKAARLGQSMAGGLVPLSGALRSVARTVDRTPRAPTNAFEQVLSGIPFASRSVPAALTPLGDRQAERTGLPAVDFTAPSTDARAEDAVTKELDRLGVAVPQIQDRVEPNPLKNPTRRPGQPRPMMGADNLRDKQVVYGRAMRDAASHAMQSDEYQNLHATAYQLTQTDPHFFSTPVPVLTRALQRQMLLNEMHDALNKPVTQLSPYATGAR